MLWIIRSSTGKHDFSGENHSQGVGNSHYPLEYETKPEEEMATFASSAFRNEDFCGCSELSKPNSANTKY